RVITAAEIGSGVTISGTTSVTGTNAVTVTIHDGVNTPYTRTATPSGGNWSVALTQAEVEALNSGRLTITASVTSGGITTTDASLPSLDLSAAAGPSISITEPIGDGRLSASENTSVTLSGTTANVADG